MANKKSRELIIKEILDNGGVIGMLQEIDRRLRRLELEHGIVSDEKADALARKKTREFVLG